ELDRFAAAAGDAGLARKHVEEGLPGALSAYLGDTRGNAVGDGCGIAFRGALEAEITDEQAGGIVLRPERRGFGRIVEIADVGLLAIDRPRCTGLHDISSIPPNSCTCST